MPTPAGHTLTALAAFALCRPLSAGMLRSPWLWLAVFSASAPDLDFVPGLLLGNESLFHRGAGHSIAAAALWAVLLLVAVFALTGSAKRSLLAAAIGGVLFAGHLLLDLVVRDPAPPFGVQLFWPLSDRYFLSPVTLFPNLDRHPFDWSVVARAVPVVAVETAILVPLTVLAAAARKRRERSASP